MVEIAWILAGIAVGAVVTYTALRGPRLGGAEVVTRAMLRDEMDHFRLEFHDVLDKIDHLYDRARKRLQAIEQTEPRREMHVVGNTKAELRARARAQGLLGGHVTLPGQGPS